MERERKRQRAIGKEEGRRIKKETNGNGRTDIDRWLNATPPHIVSIRPSISDGSERLSAYFSTVIRPLSSLKFFRFLYFFPAWLIIELDPRSDKSSISRPTTTLTSPHHCQGWPFGSISADAASCRSCAIYICVACLIAISLQIYSSNWMYNDLNM